MVVRLLFAAALLLAPVSAAVPAPESHFGFKMGEDRKLVQWAKVVSYFEALQKSSDRIVVRNLGPSTEGRPFIAATIAAPAVLKTSTATARFRSDSPTRGGPPRPKPRS